MFGVTPVETFELSIPEEGTTQSWIQVAKVGTFVNPQYGKMEITTPMLNQIVDNAKLFNPGPVDYEHLSLKPKAERRPDDCIAAGWFTQDQYELRDGGKTLWALVDWTVEAAKKIREKKFRYFSPTYAKNYFSHEDGKPIGARLLGGGLTNYPFLQGMAEVSLRAPQITLTERQQRVSQAFYEKFNANLDSDVHISEWLDEDALLALKGGKLLKVPFTVDNKLAVEFGESKEVVRIIKELSQEPVTMPNDNTIDLSTNPQFIALTARLETQSTQLGEAITAVTALTTQVTTLSTENATLRQQLVAGQQSLAEERVGVRVAKLIRSGKLAKKQEDWAKKYLLSATPEDATAWENTLQPVIALNQETGSNESDDTEAGTQSNPDAAILAFNTKVEEIKTARSLSQADAIRVVSGEFPELWEGYRHAFDTFTGDGRRMS